MSLTTDLQPLPAGSAFVEDDVLSIAGLAGDETGVLLVEMSQDGQQILGTTFLDLTDGEGAPVRATYLAVTLATAQSLPAADPPAVLPNVLYAITGQWNGGADSTVFVHGVRTSAFHRLGVIYDAQGVGKLVEVDVVAGTYEPLGTGGPNLPTVVAVNVTGDKRKQVVADIATALANGGQARILEPDTSFTEKHFTDSRLANAPYFYWAVQEDNATTGTTELWWNRFRIQ